MTDQTENAAPDIVNTDDLMERTDKGVSVTGQVGSGHKGIDHRDVIELYLGIHPMNFVNAKGAIMEVPIAWGYRKIANHYGCSVQNVRRHIKSEADSLELTVEDLKTAEGIQKFKQALINKYKSPVPKEEHKELITLEELVDQLAEALELPIDSIMEFIDEATLEDADIMQVMKDKFGSRYKTVRSLIIGLGMPGTKKNVDEDTFVTKFSEIVEYDAQAEFREE